MDVSTLNKRKEKPGSELVPDFEANQGTTSSDSGSPVLATAPDSVRESGAIESQRSGSEWMLFNIIIPCAMITGGVVAILMLGSTSPPTKPPLDQSLVARIERLPDVTTLPVRSLDAIGGKLNLGVDGEVVPYREVQMAAEVAGQVIYKDPACEVGHFVAEGQLLLRIDPTDYENEIERLTKQKEQEYQAIRELEQETINSKRLIEVAESELALQDREIKRLKGLPAGYASQSELDNAQRTRLQLLNNKVNLENQLDMQRQRRSRLESAEELVETQLAMARKNLERTEIRSPISGVIYREDAELNSFVQRGQVIVTIEDTRKSEVVINLRSDQLYWVLDQDRKTGDVSSGKGNSSDSTSVQTSDYSLPKTEVTIEYQVAGRDNEVFQWQGLLERYDGIGFDTTSRTVPVRVVVDQPRKFTVRTLSGSREGNVTGPSALVRGMFVTAVLHIEPRKPLVIVPAVALKPGDAGSRIWKFVPDPSVIALPEEKPETETGQKVELAAQSSIIPTVQTPEVDVKSETETGGSPDVAKSETLETQKLNPADWIVGRVEVVQRVRPIESIQIPGAASEDGRAAMGSSGDTLYWICEIGEGELSAGDRLIVSPLPSFEGRGRDGVRAKVEQAKD